MSDDYARPRSMADRVIEQATAAPGEYRKTRERVTVTLTMPYEDLMAADDADLGQIVKAHVQRSAVVDL